MMDSLMDNLVWVGRLEIHAHIHVICRVRV
jgi:hypothetical protein